MSDQVAMNPSEHIHCY